MFELLLTLWASVDGYYRQPSLHADHIVFVAEGDLFKVSIEGGVAHRLTSHPGAETYPVHSPDGTRIAYVGERDRVSDVYVIPVDGGPPRRLTHDGSPKAVVGWTPGGEVMFRTRRHASLPAVQLVAVDVATRRRRIIPLDRAADGAWMASTLFFTRPGRQSSETARYQGGTAQEIWRFDVGAQPAVEAVNLTRHVRTDRNPMVMGARVYFESDRPHEGPGGDVMNVWSMAPDGSDLRIETTGETYPVQGASAHEGRIVFQRGADLALVEPGRRPERRLSIRLQTDLDQRRPRVETEPWPRLSSLAVRGDGREVAAVVRGVGTLLPTGLAPGQGRRAQLPAAARLRELQFIPGRPDLVALSDQTGEMQLHRVPRSGPSVPLTELGPGFRSGLTVAPDGKRAAFRDREHRLYVTELDRGDTRVVETNRASRLSDLAWSPDGRWLAYVGDEPNGMSTVRLYDVRRRERHTVSSDRYNARSPSFDPSGQWLYFLSDRRLKSVVPSPWGAYQPEPYFDRRTQVIALPLAEPSRSPFAPWDELHPPAPDDDKKKKEDDEADSPPRTRFDPEATLARMVVVPVPAGNFDQLQVGKGRLFWVDRPSPFGRPGTLYTLEIRPQDREGPKPKPLMKQVVSFALSTQRSHLLVRTKEEAFVIPAADKPPKDTDPHRLDFEHWNQRFVPRSEWRQMFLEAWRLQRDYFYDPNLHGLDWTVMRDRYLPLAGRVTDRDELNDVLAQMMGELSALHVYVRGGDRRGEPYEQVPGRLGARLRWDPEREAAVIDHLFRRPSEQLRSRNPLVDPLLDVREGDAITAVNGRPVSADTPVDALLIGHGGRRVRLDVRRQGREDGPVLIRALKPSEEDELRYAEWERTRRERVETASEGRVGYVHLRAMGGRNMGDWAEQFYPVFRRDGLIIDVRNNRGGNIDSWILEKLLRRAWFWWKPRTGLEYANMQYAFRGPIVVLINEWTASDGEAFAEGFRRLGLGKLYGVRTWGGEIWLSFNTGLADGGIATAPQYGVYDENGVWIIEGHGVEPDVEVHNLPHATFGGEDAQLDRALEDLLRQIESEPRPVPPAPAYPDHARRRSSASDHSSGRSSSK
jgi:tricorn protease